MIYSKIKLHKITNNLDSKRIPLNSEERKKKESNALYPYVGANNILGYINEYIFDEKILCIAEDGGNWGKNQKCAFILNERCWVNNHAHVITAKPNVHLEYLCYYLNYADLSLIITGTTRGKLTKSALNNLEIPLPPLATQKHIADILDAADALRRKTQQIVDSYDELAHSLFLEIFGDPVKNEKGWDRKTIGELCEKIQIGPFGSQIHQSDYCEVGIPLINPTNISKDGIDYDNAVRISTEMFISMPQYHLSEGDIIMARRGDLSKVGIVNNSSEKLFCGTGSLFVRFKKNVNKLFLYKVLSDNSTTQFLMDKARGITMPNLNKTIIASIPIFLPPLDLQNQFAEKIALIEQQKELAKQSLAESENLFNALLQKAFKGELVPEPQPAEQAV